MLHKFFFPKAEHGVKRIDDKGVVKMNLYIPQILENYNISEIIK